MQLRRALLLVLLAVAPALAADRHVYLNSTGGGTQLNDCPNPAHNAKGTSNTDELQYCVGGTSTGKIIGTVTGTVASATCTGGGGVVTAVTNGVSADVDRDGTNEVVYGSPQACVWNMAKSDSCEVHSGTYKKPGAAYDNWAGDTSNWAGVNFGSQCQGFNCILSSVVASGFGPNMGTTGYGTAVAPGYLRGAVMNGSTDTWDSNNNKRPDTTEAVTSYPVIFSGDADEDGVLYELTNCTGSVGSTTCTGDAWSMLVVGLGAINSSYAWCGELPAFSGSEHGVMIDTDANGTYDTAPCYNQAARDTSYFYVKDIEWKNYNGGNTCPSCNTQGRQAHASQANIHANGGGSSDKLVIDHTYIHDNDYQAPNIGDQFFYALFDDSRNTGCNVAAEIKNNFWVQNNRKMINTEGSGDNGCEKRIHDNIFQQDVPANGLSGNASVLAPLEFFFMKQTNKVGNPSRIRKDRVYNNDFIFSRDGGVGTRDIFQLTFGNPCCDHCPGSSCSTDFAEVWFYGNIVRCDPAYNATQSCGQWMANFGCNDTCTLGRLYSFNNTFNHTNSPQIVDGGQGSELVNKIVEKNNAWFGPTSGVHSTQANGTTIRGNEVCNGSTFSATCTLPSSGNTFSGWFNGSAFASATVYNGTTIYRSGGPLDETGSCDPDGDGVAGVDYDGDGVNDTSWTDIAGNIVQCPTTGTTLDVGAVQSASDVAPSQTCGNAVREGTETCDGTDTGTATCLNIGGGFNGGTLSCCDNVSDSGLCLVHDCTTYDTSGCTVATNNSMKLQGVTFSGVSGQ